MADKTVTVQPSGGTYTTLAAAIAAEYSANPNLTAAGMDGILNIAIGGTWSAYEDSNKITVPAFTTDATHYLNIYTTGNARHAGVLSTGKWMLSGVNGGSVWCNALYARFDGLQIDYSGGGSATYGFYTGNASGVLYFSNCLIKGNNVQYSNVFALQGSNTTYIWNCIGYSSGTTASRSVSTEGGSTYIYSSTFIGCDIGLYSKGTVVAKNCYFGGTATEDYFYHSGTLAKTNCASEDQSADDTQTGETQTNCVAAAVALDVDTFVNVTGGSEDYHLAADGLSPLQAAGVDTSGEGAPLNFTTDIDGDAIANWSVGADDGPGGGAATNVIYMIFES